MRMRRITRNLRFLQDVQVLDIEALVSHDLRVLLGRAASNHRVNNLRRNHHGTREAHEQRQQLRILLRGLGICALAIRALGIRAVGIRDLLGDSFALLEGENGDVAPPKRDRSWRKYSRFSIF